MMGQRRRSHNPRRGSRSCRAPHIRHSRSSHSHSHCPPSPAHRRQARQGLCECVAGGWHGSAPLPLQLTAARLAWAAAPARRGCAKCGVFGGLWQGSRQPFLRSRHRIHLQAAAHPAASGGLVSAAGPQPLRCGALTHLNCISISPPDPNRSPDAARRNRVNTARDMSHSCGGWVAGKPSRRVKTAVLRS